MGRRGWRGATAGGAGCPSRPRAPWPRRARPSAPAHGSQRCRPPAPHHRRDATAHWSAASARPIGRSDQRRRDVNAPPREGGIENAAPRRPPAPINLSAARGLTGAGRRGRGRLGRRPPLVDVSRRRGGSLAGARGGGASGAGPAAAAQGRGRGSGRAWRSAAGAAWPVVMRAGPGRAPEPPPHRQLCYASLPSAFSRLSVLSVG